MNNKFLTGTGKYGIDFSQIHKVEKGYKKGVFLILLFIKNKKYPVITLAYETEKQSTRVYNNINAIIEEKAATTAQIIKLADFRKD